MAGNGPIPYDLKTAFHYRNFGLPPNAGGQRGQPVGWLDRMSMALNYYHAMKAYLKADNKAAWANDNPDVWEIVAFVRQAQRRRDNGRQST